MKTLKLKDILDRFDEEFPIFFVADNQPPEVPTRKGIKDFIFESIKDALGSCRVEPDPDAQDPYPYGWNANTTQYDENVRKFMGEEEV